MLTRTLHKLALILVVSILINLFPAKAMAGWFDSAPAPDELCDGIDNDCDGKVDEGFDMDNDGWSTCMGDSVDNDPTRNPGAVEVCNDGVDSDLDGLECSGTDEVGLVNCHDFKQLQDALAAGLISRAEFDALAATVNKRSSMSAYHSALEIYEKAIKARETAGGSYVPTSDEQKIVDASPTVRRLMQSLAITWSVADQAEFSAEVDRRFEASDAERIALEQDFRPRIESLEDDLQEVRTTVYGDGTPANPGLVTRTGSLESRVTVLEDEPSQFAFGVGVGGVFTPMKPGVALNGNASWFPRHGNFGVTLEGGVGIVANGMDQTFSMVNIGVGPVGRLGDWIQLGGGFGYIESKDTDGWTHYRNTGGRLVFRAYPGVKWLQLGASVQAGYAQIPGNEGFGVAGMAFIGVGGI